MANTRHLRDDFRTLADALIATLQKLDSRFVITSAYRSPTEQAQLFARYAAGNPGLFTVAPPGRSQHERGLAVDIARVGVKPQADALLHLVGAWWRSAGGVWGGVKDPVHFGAPTSWG